MFLRPGSRTAMPRKMTTQANAKAMSPEARVTYQTHGVGTEEGSDVMTVVTDGEVASSGSVVASTSVPSYHPSLSLSGFSGSVLKTVVSPVSVSPSRSESSMGPSE